jgi:hypothetical protein
MKQDLKPLKSFWEKPQGTVGMVGLGALVFGAGWLLLKNAAWLAAAMANLTTAVFTGIGLFALVWLLSDKQFRNLIWYLYKGMIEKATSIFIEINPIGIMKAFISELKNKRRKMNVLMGNLKQEIGKLKRKVKDNKKEIGVLMTKASAASKSNDRRIQAQKALNTRKAARRNNSTMKLSDLLKTMEAQYVQMDKMFFYSDIMIQDIEDQVDTIETERAAIHASYGVMKHAASIIAGDDNKAQLFDRALDYVVEDLGAKMGEMERFMDLSQNFIDGVDLDNEVFEMEGLAMLEAWEEDNTLDFLNQGSVDYLQVIDSKMNSEEEAEPILLAREVPSRQALKQKEFGTKKFF